MRRTKPGLAATQVMSAVIYCRVSQDDTDSGRSVTEQEAECREDADRIDTEVVRVFDDNDLSASRYAKKPRPNYEALLAYLESDTPDVLILWATSRGGRALTPWSKLLDLCRKLGIKIRVVRDGRTYDLDRSRDWETLASDGVKNAAYSEEIHDAIMRTLSSNLSKGVPHGVQPFGYGRTHITRRGRRYFESQYIIEREAAVVREIYERFAAGDSLWKIQNDFNRRGISAPNSDTWTIAKLRKILLNPAYIAKRSHYGKILEGSWPAIIKDASVWQTCNDKLADPTRRTNRNTAVQHLLSGIMTCSVCESPVKAHTNNGYPVYMCKAKHCASVRRSDAEDYVNAQVRQRLVTVRLVDPLDEESERQEVKRRIAELTERLAEIESELRNAKGRAVAMLSRAADELGDELEALEAKDRAAETRSVVATLISNPESWDDKTLMEKREFLRSGNLVDSIEVVPAGKGFVRKPIGDRLVIGWTETRLATDPNG